MRISIYFDIRRYSGPARVELVKEESSSDDSDTKIKGSNMKKHLDESIDQLFENWSSSGVECFRGVKNKDNKIVLLYKKNKNIGKPYWELRVDPGYLQGEHPVVVTNVIHTYCASLLLLDFIKGNEDTLKFAGEYSRIIREQVGDLKETNNNEKDVKQD